MINHYEIDLLERSISRLDEVSMDLKNSGLQVRDLINKIDLVTIELVDAVNDLLEDAYGYS